MNIYSENVSKYPPEFLHISLFSERPLSIINRAIRGGYSWELLVECFVPFAKSLLQILYQLNTYRSTPPENFVVMTVNTINYLGKPQLFQAHVTSVLCKLTFSQESRCRVTSTR